MLSILLLKPGKNFYKACLSLESCWISQNDCRQPACSYHILYSRWDWSFPNLHFSLPLFCSAISCTFQNTRTKPQHVAFNNLKHSQLWYPVGKDKTATWWGKTKQNTTMGQSVNNRRTRLGQEMPIELMRSQEKAIRLKLAEKEDCLQRTEEETVTDVVKRDL